MSYNMEACAECSRSCSALHRKRLDPYPIVTSFFKVMYGKQISELMILPPRFVKTVTALQGKSTYLEDSTGQKWKVNLSNVNGCLAFQKGWHEFFVDHGIEHGDFVVFHYFKGSHFAVQIFSKKGCEKPMIFSEKNYQNRRAKLTEHSSPRTDPCDSSQKESLPEGCLNSVGSSPREVHNVKKPPETGIIIQGNRNKQLAVAPKTDFLLESFLMADRNPSFIREDDRNNLFDLSIYEMPGKNGDTGEVNMLRGNSCSKAPRALQKAQNEEASSDMRCQIAKITPEMSNGTDQSRKEVVELPNYTVSKVDVPLDFSMPLNSISLPDTSEFSARVPSNQPPCKRMRIVRQEWKSGEVVCGLTALKTLKALKDDSLLRNKKLEFAAKSHKIKNENIVCHSTSIDENNGQKDLIVKPKAHDFCNLTSALSIKITCFVQQDSEYFLKLPNPLPAKVCSEGENSEHNPVKLRDPVGRLWPVIYHQKEDCKVLASGWKEFRECNNIQPGDECIFVVENIDEGIIQVQIVSHLSD